MKELWQTITDTYINYRGTGKLLALFLVSVLIVYLLNRIEPDGDTTAYNAYVNGSDKSSTDTSGDLRVSPLLFILSPISGIAYAFTRIYRRLVGNVTAVYTALSCTFMVIVIILGGRWVFASDNHYIAENRMHIKQEYVNVFYSLLREETGDIRICSTPEISTYMKMYSPRFDVMYVRPVNGDASVLKGDVRAVYDQMSLSTPNEDRVVKMLRENGYDYILYDEHSTYWNLPLEEFGYELVLHVGDYRVYKDVKESRGEDTDG